MKKLLTIPIIALLLSGCSDNSVTPPVPPPDDFFFVNPEIVIPNDAYGVFHHAIRHIVIDLPGFTDSITTATYGKAIAGFYNTPSDSTFSAAGCNVALGTHVLTGQSDNSYQYQQGSEDSSIYRGILTWNILCKSIDRSIEPGDFPPVSRISSEKNVYRLSGYTAKNDLVAGADSVIYQIQSSTYAGTTVVQKTLAGNSTQCTFSIDELLGLNTSNYGLLTVTGYKRESGSYGGKTYYFTFQQSISKLVIIY